MRMNMIMERPRLEEASAAETKTKTRITTVLTTVISKTSPKIAGVADVVADVCKTRKGSPTTAPALPPPLCQLRLTSECRIDAIQ